MTGTGVPEIWEWTEYYCPWSYIGAVRLHQVMPEFRGRVRRRIRAFPLEVYGGGPPNRHELEQEWWLAALQEPLASFAPFRGNDWPTTTLPGFEAVHAATRQLTDEQLHDFDLRVRRAFFAESRNIGRREVMLELAQEADLDMARFERDFADPAVREEVLAEGRLGYDNYGVRGTPTLMLEDGTRLEHAFATAHFEDERIASVKPLPCHGEGCLEITRSLVEQAVGIANGRR
jgi:predicted DsbA family dithiol-disulfide isomerase